MLLSKKKYFLYKMVLLVVHIRSEKERVEVDEEGCTAAIKSEERE